MSFVYACGEAGANLFRINNPVGRRNSHWNAIEIARFQEQKIDYHSVILAIEVQSRVYETACASKVFYWPKQHCRFKRYANSTWIQCKIPPPSSTFRPSFLHWDLSYNNNRHWWTSTSLCVPLESKQCSWSFKVVLCGIHS